MGKLADLPSTVLQLILSCLDISDAFRCSSLSHCFHTAATYYFYSEYVRDNWTLPLSPTAIIDFFVMKSRQLWTFDFSGEARLARIQNVRKAAQGYRFEAFATHKRELLFVKDEEIRARIHVDKPIEDVCAGVGVVGVLLKGGSAICFEVLESSAVPAPLPSTLPITHIACYLSTLVLVTRSCEVFSFSDRSMRQFTFDPPLAPLAVLDLQCKGKVLLVLCEGGRVYKAENGEIHAVSDPFFKKKRIVAVAAGLLHCLALQRDDRPELERWSTGVLADWMEQSGFGDCVSAILASKITGADVSSATDDFVSNFLSISEPERCNRLKSLLLSVKTREIGVKSTLYAWGKNTLCQFGYSKASANSPISVNLPSFRPSEYITSVFCSKGYSVIYTNEGRVMAMGGVQFKKRNPEEAITWVDLTVQINQNDPKRIIEELFVGSVSMHFLMLKRPRPVLPRKRVTNSISILKQLLWNPTLHACDFLVGCEDKDGGIIERKATDLSTVEAAGLRIRYFKRGGELVWEREGGSMRRR